MVEDKMLSVIKSCATCRYFDDEYELCRFNPPATVSVDDPDKFRHNVAWWPQVDPVSDYCGQWFDSKWVDPSDDKKWKSQIHLMTKSESLKI